MNGNITIDGIRQDIEWMHRVGIGGFHNFDVGLGTPQIVEKCLSYMTAEWKEAFKFTTKLANSLKLEMAIASSPGWSESGGIWVKPEDGMKKIVWREIRVKEGELNIEVPQPSGVTGPFQNIIKRPGLDETVDPAKLPLFYKDVAIVAFKLPAADRSLSDLGAAVTSSGGNFTLQQLTDGDVDTSILLPRDSLNGFAWIQFAFPQPQTIKAITMVGGGNPGVFGTGADPKDSRALKASDDGINFKFICTIPPGATLQQTITIPETTSKYFRVTVKNPPPQIKALDTLMGIGGKPVILPGTEIAQIVLRPAACIHMFEEKSAFAPVGDLNQKITEETSDVVATSDIIDLTGKINSDDLLNWTAPSGEWKVIRFGYSLLGISNYSASPEAIGLEVDKLDPVAVENYFENYLAQYKNAAGGLMGSKGSLQYMVNDSWEAGAQNWTTNFPAEFQKRRGYNIVPWLPVITGQIVKTVEASEQFLFDFRKTLSEMVAEYHYDKLTTILARYGMKRYSESHENDRAMIADGMEVKRTAAIPMSALWTPNPFVNQNDLTKYIADIRESASVAHLYGQKLIAAESLTALGIGGTAWAYCPENLKPSADLEFANGVNRFVIHCSVHQPTNDKIPGLGLGAFGQWYSRHETWAEQAKAWNAYLSRSSYMLQRGKFVADIVYFYGEDNNITSLFGKEAPVIPEGYNFDYINADALVNILSVKDGKLVTPAGMSYQVLFLDSNASKMSPPVLRKVSALVKAGAVVCGTRPTVALGLYADQQEFDKLVNEIWYSLNANVTPEKSVSDVLKAMNVAPDFSYRKSRSDTKILYTHRRLKDRDIYWVNNRNARTEHIEAIFRVNGKVPEIWFPDTGKITPVSYAIANAVTRVKLRMESNEAFFVVFKDKALKKVVELPEIKRKRVATVRGPWKVSFQKDRGAPESIHISKLASWTEHSDPGVKYFSGTGCYTKSILARPDWFTEDVEIWLDLGDVKNIAEVVINGEMLGIVWKKPFRVNVTKPLRPGRNNLVIKITNLWVNRLIGDQQPSVMTKITYTTMRFYRANSPLLPSGLLGPVKIVLVTQDKKVN